MPGKQITFLLFLTVLGSCTTEIFVEEPLIRVRILKTTEPVNITFSGKWSGLPEQMSAENGPAKLYLNNAILYFQTHDKTAEPINAEIILTSKSRNGTIRIKNVPYGVGWWWEGRADRTYEGEIHIYKKGVDTIEVVVHLPLEEYLKGVVPYEIGNDAPLEALKAQAVAARSEAVMALLSELYSGPNYDLTSDVECQVFSGNDKRTQRTDIAVVTTRGIILSENQKPVNAYYASNCGGHSETIDHVWPDRPSPQTYMVSGMDTRERQNLDLSSEEKVQNWIHSDPDVNCNPRLNKNLPAWSQRNFRWTREFHVDSVSKMISGVKKLGRLTGITAVKRGYSGRIYAAQFVFVDSTINVNGELTIRSRFQPALRSACFISEQKGDKFILTGAGWGHGVGMCQSGAVTLAQSGRNFQSILSHYYPKAELKKIYSAERQVN